ncbi:MAG: hypothetical protein EZS28_004849 [Streblomastix strix]|uniref:Uncharacterized protein n=1 Tax=Streblomastix strix TaxID=222440 RepID=A0A5J4WYM7_9EUKA|nr:MAG: hypothetical protein EZS28_004849 [Streblomastix strix]
MNTPQSNIRQQQSVSVVSNSNPNQNFKEPVLQQPFASAKGKPPLKNQFMYKSTVPLNSTDSSSVQSQPIVQPNITPQYAYAPAINAYQPIIQPYSMQAAQPQNMYTNQYLYSGFGFQHNSTSTQFTYRSGDKKKKP